MTQHVPPLAGLTPDQQAGADAFFSFLMSPAKTFVLSGGAGVGKTFLMSHLVRQTMKEYATACALLGIKEEFDSLVFTATTNKAAEVLEQSLGLPVQTIHSYLNLKVTENLKTGKTDVEKTGAWKIRRRLIVFIDECSMVDRKLYDIIMESLQDSKIVFVGDHAQMAPVKEKTSPVFVDVDPSNFIFLSQPVRNAGSPALIALCAQLRETVETGIFHPMAAVPGTIDYLDDVEMPAALHHYFKDLEPSARVLCYTNTRVEAFNEFIRQEVRGLPLEFGKGDTLVVAQTHMTRLNSKEVTLNVEREAQLLNVGKVREDHNYMAGCLDGEPLRYREATIKLLSGVQAELPVLIPTDKDKLASVLKFFSKERLWHSYFELKGKYIDLRDKAACTVYKSQGSTYETVFVDLGNIGTSWDAKQVARMLFVAVSRATTRVFFYGRLPPAYIGKPKT